MKVLIDLNENFCWPYTAYRAKSEITLNCANYSCNSNFRTNSKICSKLSSFVAPQDKAKKSATKEIKKKQ